MAPSKQLMYNWYISLVGACCMMLMGYDSSVYNSVQGSNNWRAYFNNPNPHYIGLINTTYSVGGIVAGWFFAGPFADWAGRRWGMVFGAWITVIATFVQFFAPRHNIGAFIAGRTLISVGTAFAVTAGPIYINEVTAASVRGKVMSCWQMFFSIGSFFAYWVNYACSKNRKALGDWDWKIVVIFQLLLPIVITAQVPFIPESPRWLISRRNDVEGARAALRRVRTTEEEVEAELLTIREAIAYEKEASPTVRRQYLSFWKDKSIRKRLGLAFLINICQQLTGQGTLNAYSSTIYKAVFNNIETVNLINALNATFSIIFTLNATWTVDRFGRRWLFFVGAAGMAICTMLIGAVGIATNVSVTKNYGAGVGIAFLAFLFAFFFKPSWGATVWIYTAEIFPTTVRATAVGMSIQMQGVSNTIFQQFFPIFYANEGLKTFFFFMSMNIFLIAVSFFLLPETKNVPLEEMDSLFGGFSHVAQGAKILDDPIQPVNIEGNEKAQKTIANSIEIVKKETV